MIPALLIIGLLYAGALIYLSIRASKTAKEGSTGYFFAGGSLGAVIGLFTFAATLFSTFTLLGMPDFFRTHGVGAWIFLAVADAGMVFGIIWIGRKLKAKGTATGKFSMSALMMESYGSPLAGYVTFAGAALFLLPYVSIQIRGVSTFLEGAFPGALPLWGWALAMVVVMLLYSETGGLKAIIYNDTLQGILLMIAIWVIGANLLGKMGGWNEMFARVSESNQALLSTPGPKGLFSMQFLLASMVAIILIPYTQPQVSTRILIMKDDRALHRMAIGVGVFAILVILPTLFVGMYGALNYPDLSPPEFINKALIADQPAFLAALVLIGLIAAAISTADSQIFALGSEMMSVMKGEEAQLLKITKIGLIIFAGLAFVFSIFSSDQLVLLARTSFAGTAMMAPMIFLGLFSKTKPPSFIPIVTLIGLLIFVLSSFGFIAGNVGALRMDLLILITLTIIATATWYMQRNQASA